MSNFEISEKDQKSQESVNSFFKALIFNLRESLFRYGQGRLHPFRMRVSQLSGEPSCSFFPRKCCTMPRPLLAGPGPDHGGVRKSGNECSDLKKPIGRTFLSAKRIFAETRKSRLSVPARRSATFRHAGVKPGAVSVEHHSLQRATPLL